MPTSECCCCVCTTHFCVFQSVIGLHTLYLIFQEQTEANSSSEDMDTQMANKGKYYKTHTVKTKVVLDFLFRKVKKNIFCHRYAQSEAQRLCQGQVGEISISSQQTGCYCATLCEYVYCMDRYTEPFSWWFAEIYKDDIWWSKSLISQKCMQLIEINSIFLFFCIWKNKVKLELNGYL